MKNNNRVTEVRSEQWEPDNGRQLFTYKVTQLIWLLLGILEGLLGLRVFLKLIAANPGSLIASLIYSFSDIFLIPFRGLTSTPAIGSYTLEISTIIAMIIYGLLCWSVERLIWLIFFKPRSHMVEVTRTKSQESILNHQDTSR